jgi:uncharacterized protein YuzB (UPF0349 family)
MAGELHIQICNSNRMAAQTDWLAELQRRRPGTRVYHEECLDRCTLCNQVAHALVRGEFVTAPTPQDLVRKILRMDTTNPVRRADAGAGGRGTGGKQQASNAQRDGADGTP